MTIQLTELKRVNFLFSTKLGSTILLELGYEVLPGRFLESVTGKDGKVVVTTNKGDQIEADHVGNVFLCSFSIMLNFV